MANVNEMTFYRMAAQHPNPETLRAQGAALFAADTLRSFKSQVINEHYERGGRRSRIPVMLSTSKTSRALPGVFARLGLWGVYVAYVASGKVFSDDISKAVPWEAIFGTSAQQTEAARAEIAEQRERTRVAEEQASHFKRMAEQFRSRGKHASVDPEHIDDYFNLLGQCLAAQRPIQVNRMQVPAAPCAAPPAAPRKAKDAKPAVKSAFRPVDLLPQFLQDSLGMAHENKSVHDDEMDEDMSRPVSPVYDYAETPRRSGPEHDAVSADEEEDRDGEPEPGTAYAAAPPANAGVDYRAEAMGRGLTWFTTDTGKCRVSTKSGSRCKHNAKDSGVCGQHQKMLNNSNESDDAPVAAAAPSMPALPLYHMSSQHRSPNDPPTPVARTPETWEARTVACGIKWYAANTGKCHAQTKSKKRCTKNPDGSGLCSAHRSSVINHEAA